MTPLAWTAWFLFLSTVWFAWRAKQWKDCALELDKIRKERIKSYESLLERKDRVIRDYSVLIEKMLEKKI